MTLVSVLARLLLLAPLVFGLSGCLPSGGEAVDEERDPFFLKGKARYSAMDYDGAIANYENALISNPRSAAAHLELGFLCEEKKQNYGAAIYHFQKHLELRPSSHMAETVKQHIYACAMELARGVPFALVSRQVQDEIRKLNSTNVFLREQNALLRTQLVAQATAFSNQLVVLHASMNSRMSSATPAPVEPERRLNASERPSPVGSTSSYTPPRPAATVPKTHIVRPGETMVTIARRYNIRLSSLQAANPAVDPRRMKAGQTLNLPGARNP